MNKLKSMLLTLVGLSILSGCASTPAHSAHEQPSPEQNSEKRIGKTLLTIGGILLVGAIVAHEAQDGAQDAIRGIDLPR